MVKISKIVLTVFVILVLAINTNASTPPSEEWNETFYTSNGNSVANSVQQTTDNGYIVVGGPQDWILKTDENGNKLWSNMLGNNVIDYATSVQQTRDGGYVLTGHTADNPGANHRNVLFAKIYSNSNVQWNIFFDIMFQNSGIDTGNVIKQTSDGGYIIGGETASSYGTPIDGFLIKTDSNGDEIWKNVYTKNYQSPDGKEYWDSVKDIVQTSDNGYVLIISREESGYTTWIVKIDADGKELWNKTLDQKRIYSLAQISDGYILAGVVPESGSPDPLLIKTDVNGKELWNKTFDHIGWLYSVDITSDNGYILSGGIYSPYRSGLIIRTDSSGNELWSKIVGEQRTESNSNLFSGHQTKDGGYIFAGYTGPFYHYAWLVKISHDIPIDDISPTVIINYPIEGTHYNSTNLQELSYSITDNLDPNPIISVAGWSTDEGTHTVTVNATDNAGNIGSAYVTYIVDNTSPIITLNGNNPTTIYIGSAYTDNGATATDNFDGPVPVISSGSVDTNTIGTYIITYTTADNAGNSASITRTIKVIYNFAGFFQPIDNLPTWNSVKAGSAIPVKFSLNEDQGLDIFATGYPVSQNVDCVSSVPIDSIEETVTAGASSLSYNAIIDQYSYIWKTDKAWKNSCRQLTMLLKDGTYHNASFSMK